MTFEVRHNGALVEPDPQARHGGSLKDVQRIGVRENGALVTVWERDDGVTVETVDDFEQYDGTTVLSDNYSNNTGAFSIDSTFAVEGSQSLYTGAASGQFIHSLSGLPYYPSIGDTIEWYSWSTSNSGERVHMCAQSETNRDDVYAFDHAQTGDRMRLGLRVGGSEEWFATDTSFTTARDDRWLRHRVETEDTGTAHAFTYELYEYNDSGEDTLLNTISGEDASASISAGQEYTTGGIGWLVYGSSSSEKWFDGMEAIV